MIKIVQGGAAWFILIAISYIMIVAVFEGNVQVPEVSMRAISAREYEIKLPQDDDAGATISFAKLNDNHQWYMRDGVQHFLCLVPFSITDAYLGNGETGLCDSARWADTFLSENGMLVMNGYCFELNCFQQMTAEIYSYWENQAVVEEQEELVGLKGILLDFAVDPDICPTTWLEQFICAWISTLTTNMSVGVAMVVSAGLAGSSIFAVALLACGFFIGLAEIVFPQKFS